MPHPFMKEGYSLRDAIHFLPDFKPKSLNSLLTNGEERLKPVLGVVCGYSLPVRGVKSDAQAALDGSSELESATPAVVSRQLGSSSRTT